jgi:hypothetical protein
MTNTIVGCAGGDVDGDGKSDIVFPDYSFTPSGGTRSGTYWLVYGRPRDATGTPDLAQLTINPGETFSSAPPTIADLDGDGLADLAAYPETENSGAGKTSYFYQWRGVAPRRTGTWGGAQGGVVNHPCNGRALLGAADLVGRKSATGKPLNSLVWYDAGMTSSGGAETGTCSTSTDGGLLFSDPAGPTLKRYFPSRFVPPLYYLCDVDADHFSDLVVLSPVTGGYNVSVVYGSSNFWPATIDLTQAPSLMLPVDGFPEVQCWPNAPAGATLAIGDPGPFSPLKPGVLHLIGVDANRTPTVKQDLRSFAGFTTDTRFGGGLSTPFDFDGDGKLDLIVTANGGVRVWLIYGR